MSSMHSGTSTLERGVTRQRIPYRGARRQICKTQFLHYFKISHRVVETVAKDKANAAVASPLSPMKSPQRKAKVNTRRASAIKLRFEKSGYSETIAWRKVQLTKQRNVDLTTDGLWAMPLNTRWVPVKARRLQDWEKLKKYVPIHKQGDVCPNGVPARVERGNNDDSDSE